MQIYLWKIELESSLFDLIAISDPLTFFFFPNGVVLSSLELTSVFFLIINLLQHTSHVNLMCTNRNHLNLKAE